MLKIKHWSESGQIITSTKMKNIVYMCDSLDISLCMYSILSLVKYIIIAACTGNIVTPKPN